jgi:multiple sugar transport system permease protein
LAAFSLANMRWKGQGIILAVVIATFIVPFETIAVPLLMIVSRLPTVGVDGLGSGWLNTYHVQIIPFIVDAFTVFLFVQFFKSVPYDLIEAARIDGASWFQIYARIIVPLSGPVFATAAILKGLVMWNQYLWPIMVVQSEEIRPVMVGLGYFFQLNTAWGEIMAYLSIITVPILVLFLSMQRVFVESIASSGIKG